MKDRRLRDAKWRERVGFDNVMTEDDFVDQARAALDAEFVATFGIKPVIDLN